MGHDSFSNMGQHNFVELTYVMSPPPSPPTIKGPTLLFTTLRARKQTVRLTSAIHFVTNRCIPLLILSEVLVGRLGHVGGNQRAPGAGASNQQLGTGGSYSTETTLRSRLTLQQSVSTPTVSGQYQYIELTLQ